MANQHAQHVKRLAIYKQQKLGEPADVAWQWAHRLTETEAAELVGLVDQIEQKRAEHAANQAEAERITDELLADERRELAPLGEQFLRRINQVANRLRSEQEPPGDPPPDPPAVAGSVVAARKRKRKAADGREKQTGQAKAG